MSTLKADSTDWLLKPENPSVRYFTLMNLLGYSKGDSIVEQTKEVIGQFKKITQIFKHQRPEGYWQSAEQPYLPKYKSAYWQIIILGQLGLDRNDVRVDRTCQYIFNFQLKDSGFTTFGKEGAKREYIWSKEMMLKKGKDISDFEDWTKNRIKENEMSCLMVNTVAALLKLGYSDSKEDSFILKSMGEQRLVLNFYELLVIWSLPWLIGNMHCWE